MHENANSWLCLISFFPFANAINAQGKIYGQREEFGVQRSHLYVLLEVKDNRQKYEALAWISRPLGL